MAFGQRVCGQAPMGRLPPAPSQVRSILARRALPGAYMCAHQPQGGGRASNSPTGSVIDCNEVLHRLPAHHRQQQPHHRVPTAIVTPTPTAVGWGVAFAPPSAESCAGPPRALPSSPPSSPPSSTRVSRASPATPALSTVGCLPPPRWRNTVSCDTLHVARDTTPPCGFAQTRVSRAQRCRGVEVERCRVEQVERWRGEERVISSSPPASPPAQSAPHPNRAGFCARIFPTLSVQVHPTAPPSSLPTPPTSSDAPVGISRPISRPLTRLTSRSLLGRPLERSRSFAENDLAYLQAYYLLLTAYYLQLTTYYSATYYLLRTTYYYYLLLSYLLLTAD